MTFTFDLLTWHASQVLYCRLHGQQHIYGAIIRAVYKQACPMSSGLLAKIVSCHQQSTKWQFSGKRYYIYWSVKILFYDPAFWYILPQNLQASSLSARGSTSKMKN